MLLPSKTPISSSILIAMVAGMINLVITIISMENLKILLLQVNLTLTLMINQLVVTNLMTNFKNNLVHLPMIQMTSQMKKKIWCQ